jgi:hypothetical protein
MANALSSISAQAREAASTRTSEGNVFFKFTGPAKTVAAAQPQFDKLLNSIQR